MKCLTLEEITAEVGMPKLLGNQLGTAAEQGYKVKGYVVVSVNVEQGELLYSILMEKEETYGFKRN